MPIEFQITLSDESIAKLASALLGGSAPSVTASTTPPAVADGKKKGAPKPAPAPAPAAEEPAAEEPAAEPTTDLVTDAQKATAKDTADAADIDNIRSELSDYYIGQGSDKKEVQNAITAMGEPELREAYLDYLARLVMEDGEFTGDFETPYIAARVNDGVETKCWVKGGVTMSDEEVKAAKLADPNAKPAAVKKGPALPKRGK